MTSPFRRVLTAAVCLAWWMTGCSGPTPPDPPNRDPAIECVSATASSEAGASMDGGAAGACPSGQICLSGRCYAACTSNSDCGPREVCGDSGACVRRTGPDPDAGPPRPDAGPVEPCDLVDCEAPQVCHPLLGVCVECSEETLGAAPGEPGFCPGVRPICDISNGVCVAVSPTQCAPCNDESECNPTDLSFIGGCVRRTVMDIEEQVCLRSCSVDVPCPSGLTCSSGFCRPPVGASCTTWRAAVERRTCFGDEDCNPLGADAAFFVNACEGEVPPVLPDAASFDGGGPDSGRGAPGTCVQPCSTATDCFDQAGGQLCEAPGFFCIVP